MTVSRARAWLRLTPIVLLLGALLGMTSPGGLAAAERVVEAGHKVGQAGNRAARPGAPGAAVERAQGWTCDDAPAHGSAAALPFREVTTGLLHPTSSPSPARAMLVPARRASSYDPRGPPSTTA